MVISRRGLLSRVTIQQLTFPITTHVYLLGNQGRIKVAGAPIIGVLRRGCNMRLGIALSQPHFNLAASIRYV